MGLYDLNHETDYRTRGEELTPALTFGKGEQKWTPNFGQPFKCILLLYVAA